MQRPSNSCVILEGEKDCDTGPVAVKRLEWERSPQMLMTRSACFIRL